jgi:hypothetical protein
MSVDTAARVIRLAQEFLERLSQLRVEERQRVRLPDVHSDPHIGWSNSASRAVSDAGSQPGGPTERFERFLDEITPDIKRLAAGSADMETAITSAVKGILTYNIHGQEVVSRDLYAPFERTVPWASLGEKKRGRG